MKPITELRDQELLGELLEAPFVTEKEKPFIESVARWYSSHHNTMFLDQREGLISILIKVRARFQEKWHDPSLWHRGIPVENYGPKKDCCPKCGSELVNSVAHVGGKGYQNFLDCENTVNFDENGYPKCDYSKPIKGVGK